MSVQSLEKTVKTKFPKDFKDLFGQIIDSGGQVRLKLHNDDFMLIDKFVPRSITGREEYDYNGRDVTMDFSSSLHGNSRRFVPLLW